MSQDNNAVVGETPAAAPVVTPATAEPVQTPVETPAVALQSPAPANPQIVAPPLPEPTAPAVPAPASPSGQDYMAAFGEELGAVLYAKGIAFADAQRMYTEKLASDLSSARSKNAELLASLNAARGESTPLGFTAEQTDAEKESIKAREKFANKLSPNLAKVAASIALPKK